MPTPPVLPDPTPLPERPGPEADTGLPGSEANKPGGGPQTADGAPGAPRRKEQPDDGWIETGTSYGGLRTRVSGPASSTPPAGSGPGAQPASGVASPPGPAAAPAGPAD